MTDSNEARVHARSLRFQTAYIPWVPLLALLALVFAACGGGDDGIGLDTRTIDLKQVNDSGYEGEVLLTSAGGDRTVVVVTLGREDAPEGDFPAAIQEGSCSGLSGNIAHDLEPLKTGFLFDEIPASLEVLEERDHALVVFESNDRNVYVACAEIP
jgi:hypothetical protein